MKKIQHIGRWIQIAAVLGGVFWLLFCAAKPTSIEVCFSTVDDAKQFANVGKEQLINVTRVMRDPYQMIDTVTDSDEIRIFGSEQNLEESVYKKVASAVEALQMNGYDVSFLMMDLETKEGLAKGADAIHYSASAIKGPYICAVNCMCPEQAVGYRDVMEQVIVNSSNEDYEWCRRVFGQEPMDEYMKKIGKNTIQWDTDYAHLSAKDFAKLWVRNYEYLFSDDENARWTRSIFDHSLNSFINEALSSEEKTVYSKAGWIDSAYEVGVVYNDAGIVMDEEEHAYVLAVMSSAYGEHELLQDLVKALDMAYVSMRDDS